MSVSFHMFNSDDNCAVCRETMTGHPDVIAHDGGNNGQLLHPYHRKCIQAWADTHLNPTCPTCRMPLEVSSLFTWKEKVIIELNHMKNDAWVGAVAGGVSATAAAVVVVVGLNVASVAGAGSVVLGAGLAGFVGSELAKARVVGRLFEDAELSIAGLAGGVIGSMVGGSVAGGVAGVIAGVAGRVAGKAEVGREAAKAILALVGTVITTEALGGGFVVKLAVAGSGLEALLAGAKLGGILAGTVAAIAGAGPVLVGAGLAGAVRVPRLSRVLLAAGLLGADLVTGVVGVLHGGFAGEVSPDIDLARVRLVIGGIAGTGLAGALIGNLAVGTVAGGIAGGIAGVAGVVGVAGVILVRLAERGPSLAGLAGVVIGRLAIGNVAGLVGLAGREGVAAVAGTIVGAVFNVTNGFMARRSLPHF